MSGRRTTRRSISLKGITYQRVKDYCDREHLSMSGYLETLLTDRLDAAGVPVPTRVEPPTPRKQDLDEIISQHFTF